MPVDIDDSSLPKFRKKLPEKLKQIRERAGLTPEEFAPHVHAKDGKTVEKYEKGKGDPPVSVLMHYWKLSDAPFENILNDDRDLCFRSRLPVVPFCIGLPGLMNSIRFRRVACRSRRQAQCCGNTGNSSAFRQVSSTSRLHGRPPC